MDRTWIDFNPDPKNHTAVKKKFIQRTCTVENSKRRDDVGFRPPRSGGRRAAERRGSGARPAAQRPGGRRDDVGYTPLGLSLCALFNGDFAPSFEYVPLPTKGFPAKPSLIRS